MSKMVRKMGFVEVLPIMKPSTSASSINLSAFVSVTLPPYTILTTEACSSPMLERTQPLMNSAAS